MTVDRGLFALVAVAAVSALVEAPIAFHKAVDQARAETSLTPTQRELAPEKRVGVDGAALLAAVRLIPPTATYFVDATPVDAETVRPMTFYALFPRRYVDSPQHAAWVLSFGAAPPPAGVRRGRRVRLGPGLTAAEVLR